MKLLIAISLLSISIGVKAQGDSSSYVTGDLMQRGYQQDSVISEKFFKDSLGNDYMIEYRYAESYIDSEVVKNSKSLPYDMVHIDSAKGHHHYIANCSIIKYHGNKQQTLYSGIKAIYSPVECAADSPKLWLERLYKLQNSRK